MFPVELHEQRRQLKPQIEIAVDVNELFRVASLYFGEKAAETFGCIGIAHFRFPALSSLAVLLDLLYETVVDHARNIKIPQLRVFLCDVFDVCL